MSSNPLVQSDGLGLRADTDLCTGLTPRGCIQVGLVNTPDYVTVNGSWLGLSLGLTVSGNTVYWNYSVSKSYSENVSYNTSTIKDLLRPSFSADLGFLNSGVGAKCGTPDDVRARRQATNNFLAGYSMSGGVYYGPGVSVAYSPGSGAATQIGIGLGVGVTPGSLGNVLFKFGQ